MNLTPEHRQYLIQNPRLLQLSFGHGSQDLYRHPLRGTYTLDDLIAFDAIEYFPDTSEPYGLAYGSHDYLNLSDRTLAHRSLTACLRRRFERGNGGTFLLVTYDSVNGRTGSYQFLHESELVDRKYTLRLVDDQVSVHLE